MKEYEPVPNDEALRAVWKHAWGNGAAIKPPLGRCLDEAKETICGERQDQYGAPEDSFQLVAEYWSTYLRKEYNIDHHHLNAKDIAHMMILFKMARCQGQTPKRDNYVDICGYASIAADRF